MGSEDTKDRQDTKPKSAPEPRGFGEHSRGLASEYAHEQGWGLNEEERTKAPAAPQDSDGGADYDYGAQDFGDEPVNMALDSAAKEPLQNTPQSESKRK